MKFVTQEKELVAMMREMIKAGNNRWFESVKVPGWSFWCAANTENDPMWPVIYARPKMREKVSERFYKAMFL